MLKMVKGLASALKKPLETTHLKLDSSPTGEIKSLLNLVELSIVSKKEINLPEEIDHLINLKNLTIVTENTCTLPQIVFKLANLQSLKIKAKKLNYVIPAMPTQSLEHIFINNCSLDKIPETLFEFTKLKTLNLANNKITEISRAITDLAHLQRLVLDSNLLTKLPIEMSKLKNLIHLSLDANKFTPNEKARIQKEFNIWFN